MTVDTRRSGFTLIELMIVVAIVGILGAIALPKFAELITKSRESNLKGSLSSMRSAVQIYYASGEGIFPNNLSDLAVNGTFIDKVPTGIIPPVTSQGSPGHAGGSGILLGDGTNPTDVSGGTVWYYVNVGNRVGSVFVNCTHLDTAGNAWTQN
jgi:prepilin-type N-terminal cleavage/methylation domain-containing protein